MSSIRRSLFLLLVLSPVALCRVNEPPTSPYRQTGVLFPSPGANFDLFGSAIAAGEELIAVGAPGHSDPDDTINNSGGVVYLYRRAAAGWSEAGLIYPPDEMDIGSIGWSLSLAGDTLAVSAPRADSGRPGQRDYTMASGAILLYTTATGQLLATITPNDPLEYSNFGRALALDGDTLLATTQLLDQSANAAYIFTHGDNGWTQQVKLPAPGGPYRFFGAAAALSGDVALIGAPGEFNNPPPYDRGVVFVYVRAGGVWSTAGVLSPDDGQRGDNFGCAVEINGDTAVIAACAYEPVADPPNQAYVFTRHNGVWTQQARLTPEDGAFPVRINSLAFDGDRVLIGAADPYDSSTAPGGGRAFLFERDGVEWRQTQILRPAGGEAGDSYVTAVGLSGVEVFASAIGKSWLNAPRHGVVYVFGPHPAGGLAYLPSIAGPAFEQKTGLIAYVRDASDDFEIFLGRSAGGNHTNLTQTPGVNEEDPAWSPDGRRLAYIRNRREIVIRDIHSGDEVIIPSPVLGPIFSPAWSPDGRHIAFHGDLNYNYDLFVVAIGGGEPINLTGTLQRDESFPVWSPDGTRLAFLDEGILSTMRPDGSDVTPVEGALRSRNSLDWSAGGDILYTAMIAGKGDIHVISAGGGVSRPIIANGHDGRWSPDGEGIVFTGAGWGIFRVNADGNGLSVVDGSQNARTADWQP